jgi:hypothetical protein
MLPSKLTPAFVGPGLPSAEPSSFKAILKQTASVPENHFAATPGPTVQETSTKAASALADIQEAQRRMEQIMALASSGRSFSPAELLSFQARVYQCSQTLDLAGKVIDKAGGGLRQVLQTQI